MFAVTPRGNRRGNVEKKMVPSTLAGLELILNLSLLEVFDAARHAQHIALPFAQGVGYALGDRGSAGNNTIMKEPDARRLWRAVGSAF